MLATHVAARVLLMLDSLHSGLGLLSITALAWLASENRRAVSWRFTVAGLALQIALAALILKAPGLKQLFAALNDAVGSLQAASEAGSSFVFGYLGGGPLPYEEAAGTSSLVFAFRFLPLVILMSALSALLTHWRVLPLVVRGFGALFARTLKVGGAVAVSSAANIFLGMVDSPLMIRPYLARLNRSELFVVMCTGMAGVAGTVLVLYATMLAGIVPDAAGHLLAASIVSVPASIVIARLMVPETAAPTPGELATDTAIGNSIDAIAQGTRQGLELFLNILAMLLVFVALVHLANLLLGLLPAIQGEALSLERLMGWVFAPVAWLMGVSWSEAATVGSLLGVKTVLNELLAFAELTRLSADSLSERSRLITTYALCGFANFGSLGIMLAGLATMVPSRRVEITALGLRTILGGTLATCSTAATVGMLY